MNDDINFIKRHVEEPVRLDNLERFVDQCGRINGDTLAHLPVWMRQGLFRSCLSDFSERSFPKRTTRGGEDQAPNFRVSSAAQALVNGIVLAIHRKQLDARLTRRRHYELTGGHQHFLVGESNLLASNDRTIGGFQTYDAHGGRDYNLCLRNCG